MSIIITLQLLYALVGAGYNVVSIARRWRGRPPLSATNPWRGMLIMALVAGVTLSHVALHGAIYLIGWVGLAVFLFRGPVMAHFAAISRGQNLHLYASPVAAFLAFAINAFGVAVGCVGVVLVAIRFAGL